MDDTLSHRIIRDLLFLFFENRKALLYYGSTYLPNVFINDCIFKVNNNN